MVYQIDDQAPNHALQRDPKTHNINLISPRHDSQDSQTIEIPRLQAKFLAPRLGCGGDLEGSSRKGMFWLRWNTPFPTTGPRFLFSSAVQYAIHED